MALRQNKEASYKPNMRRLLLLLAPLILLGADNKKKYTLEDLEWGKIVYGSTLTPASLKDKGLAIYLFMYDDPAGLEPRLNHFQANLKATKGDIVAIAVESSVNLGSKDPMSPKRIVEITKIAKKADYTFSIALGLKKRPPGYDHGLPYCYVLDSKKVIIYKGPGQGEEFIEALSKAALKAESPDEKTKDAKKEDKPKAEPNKAA
jgi:hypothetical protein